MSIKMWPCCSRGLHLKSSTDVDRSLAYTNMRSDIVQCVYISAYVHGNLLTRETIFPLGLILPAADNRSRVGALGEAGGRVRLLTSIWSET